MEERSAQLLRDFALIVLSIFVTFNLAETGILTEFLRNGAEKTIVGSVLAGGFFISAFTVAPATIILIELMKTHHPLFIASLGGIGALLGDLLIFSFVKDSLAKDLLYLVRKFKLNGWNFQNKRIRFFFPVLGALIIASPFPDEIGLVLMGLSKMRKRYFIPLSYALNFLGILILGLVARGFF